MEDALFLFYFLLVVIDVKKSVCYCYCAYALRISRYSGFLSVLLTDTAIFLRGLKLSGEGTHILVSTLGIQKTLGVTIHF